MFVNDKADIYIDDG